MAGILGAITRKLTDTVNTAKSKAQGTSAYKNTAPVKTYSDEKAIINPSGANVGSYSKQRAESKNSKAYVPGYGEVPITIENGKVQETNLPIGSIIDTAGGKFQITGATANGYTSNAYTGDYDFSKTVKSNKKGLSGSNSASGSSIAKVSSQPEMINEVPTDYQLQLQQMQKMYEQQMLEFKKQMEEQQLQVQTQTTNQNNYLNANKQNVLGAVQGTSGNMITQGGQLGVPSYNGYKAPKEQGAHIKVNGGQPGAISRYLATDMWKGK